MDNLEVRAYSINMIRRQFLIPYGSAVDPPIIGSPEDFTVILGKTLISIQVQSEIHDFNVY
jgi:hypothetical protein